METYHSRTPCRYPEKTVPQSLFRTTLLLGLLAIPASTAVAQTKSLAAIDFFGSDGIDVDAVRRALPIHVNDPFPSTGPAAWKSAVRDAVRSVTGRDPTDVAFVCCWDGNWMAYIGLPGSSSTPPVRKSAPAGAIRLSGDFLRLDARFLRAWEQSVTTGRRDDLDKIWDELRKVAPALETALLDAGRNSSEAAHRRAAVFAIGHALAPSEARLAVLLDAAHDPDATVRNNAVRGLAEWAEHHKDWRTRIPPDPGIELLRSDTWSDRNKGVALLYALTEARDPRMLAAIRARSLTALLEIAAWQSPGHSYAAKCILGRIAGIEESRIAQLIAAGNSAEILRALRQ